MYRASADPGPILVVAARAALEGVDRRTGATVWRYELAREATSWQPSVPRVVVAGEYVIVCSASPATSGAFAPARATARVTCLDYRAGRPLWQREADVERAASACVSTLLVDGGQVIVAYPHRVDAYGLEDGAVHWQRPERLDSVALAVPGVDAQIDLQG